MHKRMASGLSVGCCFFIKKFVMSRFRQSGKEKTVELGQTRNVSPLPRGARIGGEKVFAGKIEGFCNGLELRVYG